MLELKVETKDMPNHKKTIEISKIKDFLSSAGLIIESIETSENPDAIFTIRKSQQKASYRVGIEHTDYYNDATPGKPSEGQLLYEFWDNVTEFVKSKVGDGLDLRYIKGYFKLKKQELISKARKIDSKEEALNLVEAISNELISLIRKFSEDNNNTAQYRNAAYRRNLQNTPQIPVEYPNLNNYVLQIDLKKVDFWQSFKYALYADVNAAGFSVSIPVLTKIIENKKKQYCNYHSEHVDELWLLIAAPATTVHNASHSHPNLINWLDAKLLNECKSANFDKIFFWSRKPSAWCHQIWPRA